MAISGNSSGTRKTQGTGFPAPLVDSADVIHKPFLSFADFIEGGGDGDRNDVKPLLRIIGDLLAKIILAGELQVAAHTHDGRFNFEDGVAHFYLPSAPPQGGGGGDAPRL